MVIDLLNIINKRDINGNKASGTKLKQIIIDYVQDKLKVIVNRMEMQYEESETHLPQSIKEDI